MTNYVAVVGENTLWMPPKHDMPYQTRIIGKNTPWPYIENCKLSSGSPDTILLVELVESDIYWAEPIDITLDEFIDSIRTDPKGKFYNSYIKGIRAIDVAGKIRIINPYDDIEKIRNMFIVKQPHQ
jgi:hypothetical protein